MCSAPGPVPAKRRAPRRDVTERVSAGSDHEIIVLTPWSAAEMLQRDDRAFNLAGAFACR